MLWDKARRCAVGGVPLFTRGDLHHSAGRIATSKGNQLSFRIRMGFGEASFSEVDRFGPQGNETSPLPSRFDQRGRDDPPIPESAVASGLQPGQPLDLPINVPPRLSRGG